VASLRTKDGARCPRAFVRRGCSPVTVPRERVAGRLNGIPAFDAKASDNRDDNHEEECPQVGEGNALLWAGRLPAARRRKILHVAPRMRGETDHRTATGTYLPVPPARPSQQRVALRTFSNEPAT
jgi:hypothetical protein